MGGKHPVGRNLMAETGFISGCHVWLDGSSGHITQIKTYKDFTLNPGRPPDAVPFRNQHNDIRSVYTHTHTHVHKGPNEKTSVTSIVCLSGHATAALSHGHKGSSGDGGGVF